MKKMGEKNNGRTRLRPGVSQDYGGQGGQVLMELLIAVTIGAILLGSSVAITRTILRSNSDVRKTQEAVLLGQELMDNLQAYADASWDSVRNLNKGSGNHYYLNTSASPYSVAAGDETVTENTVQYTRYFYVESVNRQTSDDALADSGGVPDPATQKVTVQVAWSGSTGTSLTQYIARYRSYATHQNSWGGGAGQAGPIYASSSNSYFFSLNNMTATSTNGADQLKLLGY